MRIAVFCGAKTGRLPEYRRAAERCGRVLAKRGIGLVFGGGHIGLMGVLADAVIAAGGETIGVIPESMVESELAHKGLTRLEIVATMHQRKARMVELADAFLALPGGYGTLDELFEILTWAQLRLHAKPIGLCNVAGFFAPLLSWIQHAEEEAFLSPRHRQLLLTANDPEELIDRLYCAVTTSQPGKLS